MSDGRDNTELSLRNKNRMQNAIRRNDNNNKHRRSRPRVEAGVGMTAKPSQANR